jgi:Holliday junction resolvase RusA-like endonuclease
MTGNLMQPNLNKASGQRLKFVVENNIDYSENKMSKIILVGQIKKSFNNLYKDIYFHDGIPLVLNVVVNIVNKKNSKSKDNTVVKPVLFDVVNLVMDTLKGLVIDNKKQIVEIYASKEFSNKEKILIEIERY